MYHSRFKGGHYEAGHRYGGMIRAHGADLSAQLRLSKDKLIFGRLCALECAEVFPEVIEEIKGIAAGLRVPYENLAALIFCVYCYQFDNLCTCFAFRRKNMTVLGRNSDFLVKLEKYYESNLYNMQNAHPFIGNTTLMVQIEDGMNSHGLAAGLTFVYPKVIKPGLNAGLLVRYILEKCATVQEALARLKTLPIASAQTITLADGTGDMAAVECNCERIKVIRPRPGEDFVAASNQFVSPAMKPYNCAWLPDDIHSAERYATACGALKRPSGPPVTFARALLSGEHGFMCQYPRSAGFDTVWSSVYDLPARRIYRAEGNPLRVKYKEDSRLTRLLPTT